VHCSTVGVYGDVKEIPATEETPFNLTRELEDLGTGRGGPSARVIGGAIVDDDDLDLHLRRRLCQHAPHDLDDRGTLVVGRDHDRHHPTPGFVHTGWLGDHLCRVASGAALESMDGSMLIEPRPEIQDGPFRAMAVPPHGVPIPEMRMRRSLPPASIEAILDSAQPRSERGRWARDAASRLKVRS
jgi:hypothetical protein